MKQRILAALRTLLVVWGGLSLVAVIGVGVLAAYQLARGDQIDTASNHDVRFVLNWCGLGEGRIDKIIHSHVSSRSFTGDHLDAYAIRISRVEVAELIAASGPSNRWYPGDQLPSIVNEAIVFAGAWLGNASEIPWFPSETELRSSGVYVYPVKMLVHGTTPTAAELIFVRPADNMVFYFGAKS